MTITVPGIPFGLESSEPWPWVATATGVSVTGKPHSDLFVNPGGEGAGDASSMMNGVTLLGSLPEGDFTLTARVRVDFRSTFDAGVLLLWADPDHWAKLCFEFSPLAEPMVVSVVTRQLSDDANGCVVAGNEVWLRIARIGRTLAFHSSVDGQVFSFARAFNLGVTPARIGFLAQSPTGEGCAVEFSDVEFSDRRLDDLRDGS